jgi:hypothetical protein
LDSNKKTRFLGRVLGGLGVTITLSATGNFTPKRQRRLYRKIAVIRAKNVQFHDGRMVAWGEKFVKNFELGKSE